MAPTPEPTPIAVSNLLRWIRDTRRVDDQRYTPSPRKKSVVRVLRALFPRVRSPVFVVGAPRSGTSFLGDAVGALPELSYHYEPPITKAASRYVHDQLWSERRARFFYRSVYRWLLARHLDADLRFAEKTPQNCFVMEFLARAFDGARFLHIVRDGRDAALSYAQKRWLTEAARGSGKREAGGYPIGPYARYWIERERRTEFEATTDFHRCIWAWRRHVEAAVDATARLPGQVLVVRYEDLVRDPDRHATDILDFLSIDGPSSRGSLVAALGKADRRSLGRHREELSKEDADIAEREAGPLLRALGYTSDPNRSAAASRSGEAGP